jgi:hypothetical protein
VILRRLYINLIFFSEEVQVNAMAFGVSYGIAAIFLAFLSVLCFADSFNVSPTPGDVNILLH